MGLPRHFVPRNDKERFISKYFKKGPGPFFSSSAAWDSYLSPFLLSRGFFDFFNDVQECLGRIDSYICKNLAVERDIRLL